MMMIDVCGVENGVGDGVWGVERGRRVKVGKVVMVLVSA